MEKNIELSKSIADLPELPEGLIWRVSQRMAWSNYAKTYTHREGYKLSVVKPCVEDDDRDIEIWSEPIRDLVKLDRRKALTGLVKAAKDKWSVAVDAHRDSFFWNRQAKKEAADNAEKEYCALEDEKSVLDWDPSFVLLDITAEDVLANADRLLPEVQEELDRVAKRKLDKIAQDAREAASAAFVGDYPPLKLSEIGTGHGV